MRFIKKFSFVVIVAMIFSLTACGSSSQATKDDVYLTLVNKTHALPDDWTSKIYLGPVHNSLDEEVWIEYNTYVHYLELKEDCAKHGVQIELDSVYRSEVEQQEIWDEFTDEYGIDYVKSHVAVPGFSEHHTGLAVDIFIMKDGQEIRENEEMVADREDFAIVHSLLARHGFILRYPEGKDDLTGYAYEPWHFRYVGSINVAKEIMSKGLTFEEYLDKK